MSDPKDAPALQEPLVFLVSRVILVLQEMTASRANVDQEAKMDLLAAGEQLVIRAHLVQWEQLALEVDRVSKVSLVQMVRKAHEVTLVIQGSLGSRDRLDNRVKLDKLVFKAPEVNLAVVDQTVRWDNLGQLASLVSLAMVALSVP